MAKNSIPIHASSTDALLRAYLAASYQVALVDGSVSLTIGAPAPPPLARALPARDWTLITAWNPQSVPCDRAANAAADRALVADLDAVGVRRLRASSSGSAALDHWHEDGWLVADLGTITADILARRYGQAAILHWAPHQPVRLRMYRRAADARQPPPWIDWVGADAV